MITVYENEAGERFTQQQIREMFPNTSFPVDFVPPDGFIAVEIEEEKSPQKLRMEAKMARAQAISKIVVTTSTGKWFDGDEESRSRMTSAILGMQIAQAESMPWTLADNTTVDVTLAELSEALVLTGREQSRLWRLP